MSKVSVDVKADTSSAVNAPVLTDNTITGPVNIICGSNTAEQQNSTEKLTQEQENMTQLVTVKCRVNETVDLETLTLNNPVECKKGFVESEQHYYHDLLHITLTFVHTSSTVALLEVTSLFKLHQKTQACLTLFFTRLRRKFAQRFLFGQPGVINGAGTGKGFTQRFLFGQPEDVAFLPKNALQRGPSFFNTEELCMKKTIGSSVKSQIHMYIISNITETVIVCKHNCTTTKQLSSFEKCVTCEGPFSPLKWVGVKCKVLFHQLMQMLSESEVDELSSGDEYVPGSASDMETDSDQENAGMFVRQELWRHMKRCQSKPAMSDESAGGRHRVLTIAAVAKSAFSGQVDDGLMKDIRVIGWKHLICLNLVIDAVTA
ncbi:hypothetical protein E1301_Tti023675 [Triplophysa tibetana]|uniref:Uncharacterized protein n=1 Tax=Triplophysa tibetana TaxID=1572043 RepID=A0A5A9PHR6_9TELE|nr:hypothetical protein E1301_Tti023675 [Triplophysa tibetana]